MQELSYTYRDKSDWPDGPWKNEPDKMQWKDEKTGFPCLIVRNDLGALCGYVGVPKKHPAHGLHYAQLHDLEVHGGLTFSDKCRHDPQNHGICHLPEPGEPDNVWWLGFDCAHLGDYHPPTSEVLRKIREEMNEKYPSVRESPEDYKTIDYVREECRKLAGQLSVPAAGGHRNWKKKLIGSNGGLKRQKIATKRLRPTSLEVSVAAAAKIKQLVTSRVSGSNYRGQRLERNKIYRQSKATRRS